MYNNFLYNIISYNAHPRTRCNSADALLCVSNLQPAMWLVKALIHSSRMHSMTTTPFGQVVKMDKSVAESHVIES